MRTKGFSEALAPRLRDREFLADYLAACLEEGTPTFLLGLREAVQARDGGFSWLARETGMVRAGLYQALSAGGNPSFRRVQAVLKALDVAPSAALGGSSAPQRPESQVVSAWEGGPPPARMP
jgi:probable addiction module antidote protein